MRFDKINIYHVAMPLIAPWITSYGSDFEIHSILLNVKSSNHSVWSETCSLELPTYSYESANSIFYNISEVFGPNIIGKDFKTSNDLNNQLSIYKGNPFAKAGLDIAWWNLKSEMSNTPLHILLGGKKNEVIAGFAGSTADAFTLIERLERKLERSPGHLTKASIELAKDWRTDKYLRNLEAMLIVSDGSTLLILTGSGDVLEPENNIAAVGSGGNYALAAARGLYDTAEDTEVIASKALKIASEICVYTNGNLISETLKSK